MPNAPVSEAGTRIQVLQNGVPQGLGELNAGDLHNATEGNGAVARKAVTGALLGPNQDGTQTSPSAHVYLRIDTPSAAGNTDRTLPANQGPWHVVDMKIIRTAGPGDATDDWALSVQRQGAGAFAAIYAASAFTGGVGTVAAGDYIDRVAGEPIVLAERRVVAGDVLRVITTNGAKNESAAMVYVELAPVV